MRHLKAMQVGPGKTVRTWMCPCGHMMFFADDDVQRVRRHGGCVCGRCGCGQWMDGALRVMFDRETLAALAPHDLRVDGPIFNATVKLLATLGEIREDRRAALESSLRLSLIHARHTAHARAR